MISKKINVVLVPQVFFQKAFRHQQRSREQISFPLIIIGTLAGDIVSEANAEVAIDMQLFLVVEQ